MATQIKHFLLIFDHAGPKLLAVQHFGEDTDAAVTAYGQAEERFRDTPNIDIVLVGSDSLETVKLTHANYFDGTAGQAAPPRSKYLAGV